MGGLAWGDVVAAVGLMLVFEGVIYGGFPAAARRMAAQVSELPDSVLRAAGLGAACAGLIVIWLVRG